MIPGEAMAHVPPPAEAPMDDVVRLILNPLDAAGKQWAELIGRSAITFPIGLSITFGALQPIAITVHLPIADAVLFPLSVTDPIRNRVGIGIARLVRWSGCDVVVAPVGALLSGCLSSAIPIAVFGKCSSAGAEHQRADDHGQRRCSP